MAINIGNNSLSAAKLGTTNISSIWLGDVKLWPTIVYYKFQAEYSDGTTYDVECNQSTTLSSAETKGNTTSFYDMSACTIGDCVTVIGADALSETEITSIDIPSSVTEIGQGALSLTHLTALTIPSSVITVGQGAAEWNNDLSTLNLNEGLVTIGNSAFRWNKNLSSVTIPSTVTSIGNEAFWEDSGLTDVTVYAVNPPTLGIDVFSTNVGGVHVPISCTIHVPCESLDTYKAATNWSTYANQMQPIQGTCPKLLAKYSNGTTYKVDCDGSGTLATGQTKPKGYKASAMTEAIIGECVTTIGNYAFGGMKSLSSLTMPDSVTSLDRQAFSNCTSLTNVTLSQNIGNISDNCFYNCAFSSIDIPSSVTTIGQYAFTHCGHLSNVTLHDGLQTIGENAFEYCSALESVTIPSSVTSLNSPFYACSALTSITIFATTPPTLSVAGLYGLNCDILVPCESVNAYKTATNWSDYASRIQPIPNSCPKTLQWVTFNSMDDITSDMEIYGVRGTAYDLSVTFYNGDDVINFDLSRNDVNINIDFGNCYSDTVYKTDNVELIFSDLGCNDYYQLYHDVLAGGTIQLYIYA